MVASAVEKAYQAAEAETRRVLDARGTRLDFSGEQFRALHQSPAAVRGITGLIYLNLNRTAVADLPPISLPTTLQDLSFNDTDVADLTPIAGLTSPKSLSRRNWPAAGLATPRLRNAAGQVAQAGEEGRIAGYRRGLSRNVIIAPDAVASGVTDAAQGLCLWRDRACRRAVPCPARRRDHGHGACLGQTGHAWLEYILVRADVFLKEARQRHQLW